MKPIHLRFLPLLTAVSVSCLPAFSRAQAYPPAYVSTSSYAAGDQVQYEGNVLRAIHASPTGGFNIADWELWEVRSNTTVMIGVGQTFPTLTAAWTYAENATIAQGAYLHLYISTAKGMYVQDLSSNINLDQPCGASISIIGDNEDNIEIVGGGFVLESGHSISYIDNLELFGSNQLGTGIALTGNATIGTLNNVSIANFMNGITVELGARLHCTSTVNLNGYVTGVSATRQGSVVFDNDVTIRGNGIEGGATALYAAFDGYIEAPYAMIVGNTTGVLATQGGTLMLEHAVFNGNSTALFANMRSHVDAESVHFGQIGNDVNTLEINCSTGATVDGTSANDTKNSVGSNDGSFIY